MAKAAFYFIVGMLIFGVYICIKNYIDSIDTFTDDRDGRKYKYVKIGNQVWMAENLKYVIANSLCYDKNVDDCKRYGRLYNWEAAMKACPNGWRLPTDADWENLHNVAGKDGGKKLWHGSTDDFGFAALHGGYWDSNKSKFIGKYEHTRWWSAIEYDESAHIYWLTFERGVYINNSLGGISEKSSALSVRCIKN